ncbi:MAG: PfaD family polyunsaturated fatty acid/polyketide biosynthesis protein [Planctomycetota bacterium]
MSRPPDSSLSDRPDSPPHCAGWWWGSSPPEPLRRGTLARALLEIHKPIYLVRGERGLRLTQEGTVQLGGVQKDARREELCGHVPPCPLEHLGDPSFSKDHGLRYPYVAGAMANGIASVEVVEAMARGGLLSFFGAAGLPPRRVEHAIEQLAASVGELPYGFNLIHSPGEPQLETEIVELYIRRGVHRVEASAYLDLTLPVVRYRVHGIHRNGEGRIVTPNRIIAKVSRIEVATKFLSPPPRALLEKLLHSGTITADEAELAAQIPMAQDVTAEADSGGHTDNRPLLTLLPTLVALRDRMQKESSTPLRIGAAGGIATPAAANAAFAMGAAYLLTGSINQACREAGTSEAVRRMLAEAEQADVAMAPAADMFEMGVKVQVLKRGTLFAMRAARLYEIYRSFGSLEEIPPRERAQLEKQIFRAPLAEVWQHTRRYFQERDRSQVERALKDEKHKMALVFRWYLGLSSEWANSGESSRQIDYQVWCGPAMAAFNEWVRGSFLEDPEERDVVTVALNLLYGAAVIFRAQVLRSQGVAISSERFQPLRRRELEERLGSSRTRAVNHIHQNHRS